MKKEIIKIKTKPQVIKVGNIVQFDDLSEVKAVKFKDCKKCCYYDNCSDKLTNICDYISDGDNPVMFKEIKQT